MANHREARFEQDKNFDPVAYAEEVMKSVGSDFHEDDPLFQTNEFRMYCYKILPCTKHFCHDWSVCPFGHFSERAKRRDPKEVKYTAIACPDMKKGEDCPRADRCPYSHNTFEYWLHPTRYRTRLCRDHEKCNRKICFFAHRPEEVRVPQSRPSLPISEESWTGDILKEEKESLAPRQDNNKLDQVNKLQAMLSGSDLRINTKPKTEPTFVEQVLNGMIPTSDVNTLSLTDLQFTQAAQNLSFDSCFQSPGFAQGAVHPMAANNIPMLNAFQGLPPVNGFPQLPFVSSGVPDLSFAQCAQPMNINFSQPMRNKIHPDLNDVIQLLSMQATSPTSVLAQRHLGQGGLSHHAFSNESTSTGMGDADFDTNQLANALMGLTGPASAGNSTIFGMNL